mmetsp:Transcript_9527/g.21838  ORF Transcript_9527/g.21838 Transcript_9527/m.21838 type:complete len:325 (+) Transcript_9527:84-1058(+)
MQPRIIGTGTADPPQQQGMHAPNVMAPVMPPVQQGMEARVRIYTDSQSMMTLGGKTFAQKPEIQAGENNGRLHFGYANEPNSIIYSAGDNDWIHAQRTTKDRICCYNIAPTYTYSGILGGLTFAGRFQFHKGPRKDCLSGHRPAYKGLSVIAGIGDGPGDRHEEIWYVMIPESPRRECAGQMCDCTKFCTKFCGLVLFSVACPCLACCMLVCKEICRTSSPPTPEAMVNIHELYVEGNNQRGRIQWAEAHTRLVDVLIEGGNAEQNLALVPLPWLLRVFEETPEPEKIRWGKPALIALDSLPKRFRETMRFEDYMRRELNAPEE